MKRIEQIKKRFRKMNVAIIFFGFTALLIFVIRHLTMTYASQVGSLILSVISTLLFVTIVLFSASVIARILARPVQKTIKDQEVENRLLLGKLSTVAVYFIALVIILWRLGINEQNITIFLGFVATGLAFSVRDVFSSYLAWMVLLVKKPFRIGDHIRIDTYEGKVMHIGTFFVVLDDTPTTKDEYVRIPTTQFLQKAVHNFGRHNLPAIAAIKVTKVKSIDTKKLTEAAKDINGSVRFQATDGSLQLIIEYSYPLGKRQEYAGIAAQLLSKYAS